ncbi:MAG: hypothetical protein HYR85_12410 [Planctomycetes bacterium]|nr:hypothetical protein [Planctomycetota bacterium]MBI3846380.1 hypothetical protein [Planctomycetota bacterium]
MAHLYDSDTTGSSDHYKLTLEKIELNRDVADDAFAMPRAAATDAKSIESRRRSLRSTTTPWGVARIRRATTRLHSSWFRVSPSRRESLHRPHARLPSERNWHL